MRGGIGAHAARRTHTAAVMRARLPRSLLLRVYPRVRSQGVPNMQRYSWAGHQSRWQHRSRYVLSFVVLPRHADNKTQRKSFVQCNLTRRRSRAANGATRLHRRHGTISRPCTPSAVTHKLALEITVMRQLASHLRTTLVNGTAAIAVSVVLTGAAPCRVSICGVIVVQLV